MRDTAAPRLRPGDVIEVEVDKPVYRGQGLARHAGQVVFVPRGIPGDRVRLRVENVRSGFVRGRVEEVLRRGEGHREAPCPLFAKCGGCAHQAHAYETQLRVKEAVLRDALSRSRVAWTGPIARHPSPEEGWRTRASLHVQVGADGVRLGLHEEGSHRVVDIDRCLQLSPAMNRTQRAVAAALGGRPDLARRIQHVDLAESLDGGQLVASLETDLPPAKASSLSALGDGAPWLTGLGAAAGSRHHRTYVSLRGEPYVESTIHGVRLRAHVESFFQANRFLVEDLVDGVLRHVPPGGDVLDLYAGVGLFALPLAQRAERVRGVEISPRAVEDAEVNVARSGRQNVRVERGDVLEALARWRAEPGERIVLDPPRTGAGPEVVAAIAARAPAAIVYVSCDPPTLARDLEALGRVGYVPQTIEMFDLFPDTFHLETVVVVKRAADQ